MVDKTAKMYLKLTFSNNLVLRSVSLCACDKNKVCDLTNCTIIVCKTEIFWYLGYKFWSHADLILSLLAPDSQGRTDKTVSSQKCKQCEKLLQT